MTIVFDANPNPSTKTMQDQEEDISKSQIEGLRDLGFTWSKIAAMIGVSRITLHRRIRELGLEEETRYSEIDDQELDVFVRTIFIIVQFKKLFDQLSYVLTDITVPRLKDAKEKQIRGESFLKGQVTDPQLLTLL